MAAFLKDGNQFVECWAGVRSHNDDPYRMKKLFSLYSGFRLNLAHDFVELLGSELSLLGLFVFQNLDGEPCQHFAGMRPRQCFGVVLRIDCGVGVVVEYWLRALGKLLEPVNIRSKKPRNA